MEAYLNLVIHELTHGHASAKGGVLVVAVINEMAFAFSMSASEIERYAEATELVMAGNEVTSSLLGQQLARGIDGAEPLKGLLSQLVTNSHAWQGVMRQGLRIVYVRSSGSAEPEVLTDLPSLRAPGCEETAPRQRRPFQTSLPADALVPRHSTGAVHAHAIDARHLNQACWS